MTDDLVKRLGETIRTIILDYEDEVPTIMEAQCRIEQLEARVLLLEGWLTGSLNIIERFVACDTTEARAALGENKR